MLSFYRAHLIRSRLQVKGTGGFHADLPVSVPDTYEANVLSQTGM